MAFWNFKVHPEWHSSSNKTIPPNPSWTEHQLESKHSKYEPMGTVLTQTTTHVDKHRNRDRFTRRPWGRHRIRLIQQTQRRWKTQGVQSREFKSGIFIKGHQGETLYFLMWHQSITGVSQGLLLIIFWTKLTWFNPVRKLNKTLNTGWTDSFT